MRYYSNLDFLEIWERGSNLHPLDRGILILDSSLSSSADESAADWPLGRRNQALAELRSVCFGPLLKAWTACVRCGEKLEFEMDARLIANDNGASPSGTFAVKGRHYRLPTSRDLALASLEPNIQSAAVRIVEACRVEAEDLSEADWSEENLDEIGQEMVLADPMAEILMDFICPECSHRFSEALDLIDFVWSEVEARARRLLGEIHSLATAYGWTESQVLSLSDRRRAFYLEMVRG